MELKEIIERALNCGEAEKKYNILELEYLHDNLAPAVLVRYFDLLLYVEGEIIYPF